MSISLSSECGSVSCFVTRLSFVLFTFMATYYNISQLVRDKFSLNAYLTYLSRKGVPCLVDLSVRALPDELFLLEAVARHNL